MLVVSDLTPPIDETVGADLHAVFSRAAEAGARLLGDAALFVDQMDGSDEQIDLVAELQAARGQRPVDSGDVHATVLNWLSNHADVDAVMWIAPAAAPEKGIQYSVFTASTVISGHAVEMVEPVLADAVLQACSTIN